MDSTLVIAPIYSTGIKRLWSMSSSFRESHWQWRVSFTSSFLMAYVSVPSSAILGQLLQTLDVFLKVCSHPFKVSMMKSRIARSAMGKRLGSQPVHTIAASVTFACLKWTITVHGLTIVSASTTWSTSYSLCFTLCLPLPCSHFYASCLSLTYFSHRIHDNTWITE